MSEEKPPVVAVLGGINGAGKTTASQFILRHAMKIPAFVNADTIARGLNAFDPESDAMKAGRIMLEHLHELAAKRKSFAFETTLAARTYAASLKQWKQEAWLKQVNEEWAKDKSKGEGWWEVEKDRGSPPATRLVAKPNCTSGTASCRAK